MQRNKEAGQAEMGWADEISSRGNQVKEMPWDSCLPASGIAAESVHVVEAVEGILVSVYIGIEGRISQEAKDRHTLLSHWYRFC
jgi:hypothetical protein